MGAIFINKILMLIFCLSCLNVFRRLYYFIQTWFYSTLDQPVKYKLTNNELFLLGLSIAYILTVFSTGIKI